MAFGDYAIRTGNALGSSASKIATNVANSVIRKAEGYAMGQVRNAIDSVIGKIPSSLISLANPAEDFNRLRHINRQLVHTDFQAEWNFRLHIDGAPPDFDFYIKDITYSTLDIATDEENYGAATNTWPTGDQPLRLSFTMRDNIDGRNTMFFAAWWGQVVGANGNVGLPLGLNGYVRQVVVYDITTEGNEIPYHVKQMYPIQVGEVSRSRENGQFTEIPVTLVQFSTII